MKGSIMQPTYLPWIGYFAMIDQVDCFVFLDHVQLSKQSWQVRNRIKEKDGKELMLSIPVVSNGMKNTKLCDAVFANDIWKIKHLKSFKQCYIKSSYYGEIMQLIEKVYEKEYFVLSEFTSELIKEICNYIGIDTKFYKSSEYKEIKGIKDEYLVNLCKYLNIDTYLSAKGSAVYIEKEKKGGCFTDAKIKLEYQNYSHPIYNQLGSEFMPYMGIVDILFNEGKRTLEIIRSGNRTSYNSDNVFDYT